MHRLFKKTRFTVRFISALVSKYYLAILAGVVLGITTFFVFPRLAALFPKLRPTQTFGVIGRYAQSEIPLDIQQKISLGLTTLSPDGLPGPGLAKSWTISPDGTVYTFTLDPLHTWQDGSAISSQDIDYHFRDATTEFPDSKTLVIKLKEPFAPLPVTLAKPVFKTAVSGWPIHTSKLLGAGTYKIKDTTLNGTILQTLFLQPTDAASDLPNLKYQFYPTEDLATTAFKLGLIDTVVSLNSVPQLAKWPNSHVYTTIQYQKYVGVFFNTQDGLFSGSDGKNLRLALASAIDKTRFTPRAFGPISPVSWAYNDDLKHFDQDLQRAKSLLTKIEKPPTILTLTTSPVYQPLAEKIKADWELLGITTDIVIADSFSQASILLASQAIPIDPDQYNFWHSTQSTNFTQFHNPRIDKLLEDGRKSLDLTVRKNIYLSFQKFLVDEAPAIFLYYPSTYTLTRI